MKLVFKLTGNTFKSVENMEPQGTLIIGSFLTPYSAKLGSKLVFRLFCKRFPLDSLECFFFKLTGTTFLKVPFDPETFFKLIETTFFKCVEIAPPEPKIKSPNGTTFVQYSGCALTW